MAWLPKIIGYHPFYIQTAADAKAWSTEVFGLVAKSNPYPMLPNPKAPYNNDWKDAHGDDEYVGEMFYEAQEFSVGFYCKVVAADAEKVLRAQMMAFFEKIRAGEFMVYDDYTGYGRRKVRYAGYEEESFLARDGEGFARVIFKVKFKVNDPVTEMYYSPDSQTISENPMEGATTLVNESGAFVLATESGLIITAEV